MSTMRVDPETRLPVYMLVKSSKNPTSRHKYTFDYPADGPADIYALGVPAKITIDDRMPPQDCQQVLRAMAASRARIGDFRLVVGVDPPGSRRLFDRVAKGRSVANRHVPTRHGMLPPEPERGEAARRPRLARPFAEQLKLCWMSPNLLCDGRMVYRNTHRGSQDSCGRRVGTDAHHAARLLSGEGLGYIDLAPAGEDHFVALSRSCPAPVGASSSTRGRPICPAAC